MSILLFGTIFLCLSSLINAALVKQNVTNGTMPPEESKNGTTAKLKLSSL